MRTLHVCQLKKVWQKCLKLGIVLERRWTAFVPWKWGVWAAAWIHRIPRPHQTSLLLAAFITWNRKKTVQATSNWTSYGWHDWLKTGWRLTGLRLVREIDGESRSKSFCDNCEVQEATQVFQVQLMHQYTVTSMGPRCSLSSASLSVLIDTCRQWSDNDSLMIHND